MLGGVPSLVSSFCLATNTQPRGYTGWTTYGFLSTSVLSCGSWGFPLLSCEVSDSFKWCLLWFVHHFLMASCWEVLRMSSLPYCWTQQSPAPHQSTWGGSICNLGPERLPNNLRRALSHPIWFNSWQLPAWMTAFSPWNAAQLRTLSLPAFLLLWLFSSRLLCCTSHLCLHICLPWACPRSFPPLFHYDLIHSRDT